MVVAAAVVAVVVFPSGVVVATTVMTAVAVIPLGIEGTPKVDLSSREVDTDLAAVLTA